MIGLVVRLLRPAIEPVLKLRLEPPRLPEAGSAVETLRPTEQFLAYQYLGVAVANLCKTAVLVALVVLACWKLRFWGVVIAVPIALLDLGLVALTLVATRIDWELRHYVLGERSLRVRQGAIVQREITLSYANIQNVEVTQGPIERLFGFRSLKVSTAGGARKKDNPFADAHEAWLMGLADAEAIREKILASLRKHKDSGLGDRDDAGARASGDAALDPALLVEIRDAARALREVAEERAK